MAVAEVAMGAYEEPALASRAGAFGPQAGMAQVAVQADVVTPGRAIPPAKAGDRPSFVVVVLPVPAARPTLGAETGNVVRVRQPFSAKARSTDQPRPSVFLALEGIPQEARVEQHPVRGASVEGVAALAAGVAEVGGSLHELPSAVSGVGSAASSTEARHYQVAGRSPLLVLGVRFEGLPTRYCLGRTVGREGAGSTAGIAVPTVAAVPVRQACSAVATRPVAVSVARPAVRIEVVVRPTELPLRAGGVTAHASHLRTPRVSRNASLHVEIGGAASGDGKETSVGAEPPGRSQPRLDRRPEPQLHGSEGGDRAREAGMPRRPAVNDAPAYADAAGDHRSVDEVGDIDLLTHGRDAT